MEYINKYKEIIGIIAATLLTHGILKLHKITDPEMFKAILLILASVFMVTGVLGARISIIIKEMENN